MNHSMITLSIHFNKDKWGPGMWKLNNMLLEDQDYYKKIYEVIDETLREIPCANNGLRWEMVKMCIREASINFSKRRTSGVRKKLQTLEKKNYLLLRKIFICLIMTPLSK